MITLNELHIKTRFKNLEDLHINFTKNDAVTVFIGNNGSGKSNIIEALSSIFAGLYNHEMNPEFSYELKYRKDNNDIQITYNHTSTRNKYTFNNIPEGNYLPNQVIGLYSGEELRLWERYYYKFYDSYNKNVLSSKAPVSEYMRMLFINKYHWDIALLTMLQSDLEIDDILGDKEVSTITFNFDKNAIDNVKNYNKKNPNEVTRFSLKILETDKGSIEFNNGITSIEFPIELFKKEFVQTHTEFFKLLSVALLPRESSWKLITSIELWFRYGFSSKELSEGEKKLLLIKFITRILSYSNSLFLLDEPDSHIHINNKERIKKQLYDFDHKAYVQSVITTHSPTLSACFNDDNLYMLDKGKIVEKHKHEIIESLTGEFWNRQQQNVFLTSDKPIVLLVEGKHDKEHISNAFDKLKDEYPELSFDVFYMNSACNIPLMLTGLRTSEIVYNKIFIGIFDDDTTGNVELSNSSCRFPDTQNSKRHKEGYFAFRYPKHSEHKSEVFTVENFFDYVYLEYAYNFALNHLSGKFEGKSIDSISESIKEKAKSILFENSKLLTDKEDFKHFRKLFDQIKEIVKYYNDNKIIKPVIMPIDKNETTIKTRIPTPIPTIIPTPIPIPTPTKKTSAKDNHLKYWTSFKEFVERHDVSFKLQSPAKQHWIYISVGSSDFKISLIANTMKKYLCIQFCFRGKNALLNFKKFQSNYETDASFKISHDLEWKENKGKKEHYVNLFLDKNDPFNESDWERQHKILMDFTEIFYNYFKPLVKSNKK